MKDINPQEVKLKLNNGEKLNLLDVREYSEFNNRKIPECNMCLPLSKINNKDISDISFLGKNEEIIVYCAAGSRSLQAQQLLTSFGYSNIINMIGGLNGY